MLVKNYLEDIYLHLHAIAYCVPVSTLYLLPASSFK